VDCIESPIRLQPCAIDKKALGQHRQRDEVGGKGCAHESLTPPAAFSRFIVRSLGAFTVGCMVELHRLWPLVCCVWLSHVSQPMVHPWLNQRHGWPTPPMAR